MTFLNSHRCLEPISSEVLTLRRGDNYQYDILIGDSCYLLVSRAQSTLVLVLVLLVPVILYTVCHLYLHLQKGRHRSIGTSEMPEKFRGEKYFEPLLQKVLLSIAIFADFHETGK